MTTDLAQAKSAAALLTATETPLKNHQLLFDHTPTTGNAHTRKEKEK